MKSILVIKPSSLGDIIHGLQIVESIRAQLPQLHITWVVESAFKAVVEACSTVDAVIVFERKGGVAAFVRLLKELRSQEYDAVLDLQGLARSGLMTCAARSGKKIGRSDAREGAGLFYSKRASQPIAKNSHAVEILAKFLPALGLKEKVVSSLRFDFPELANDDLLASLKDAVLIFPESRRAEKEWPAFAEFLQRAAQEYPQRTFAWCASDRSAELCPSAGNIINIAGKTDLRQVIALIQEASVVVANDSGPVHIAAAVGTPVLGLYGPTPPALYGPYPLENPSNRTIQSEDGTMASITVDQVMAAMQDFG
ncbi:glycosyltransferase family 9 protein [Coraliomargarita sp. W4R53]